MAIDIRAEVSCSLGTLISGSFADDYLQGNGLIKTRGEVVLAGTLTPVVGTSVSFTYDKNGNTYTVPRVLRVLSSFADPFRRTTTVQLGCKLTYLENRKPPVENPSSKDENSTVPCKVFLQATLPISADYVFQQCLSALGISSEAIPLTSKFSVEEFDLTPGYLQVMSDLLQSEGYVGYLDSSETLKFINLTVDAATGPVITPADVVDLGPIGSGELPGESVLVRWSNLRLLAPDALYGDNYLKRSWEVEEVFGAPAEVSVSYTDDQGNTITDNDVFYPYSFTATRYDVWDRKIESISLNQVSSAEVNNRWASDAFRKGSNWNRATNRVVQEVIEYELAAPAANSVNLMDVQGVGSSPTAIKAALAAAAQAHTGLANLCKEEVPQGSDVVKSQTTYNYFSELELAGSLNIDTYISDAGTLVSFDTIAAELDSTVTVEYETDSASGVSKTLTKRSVSRSQTVSGQQDLATRAQDLDTANLSTSIDGLLTLARRQIYVGADSNLHTQRQYGLQKRPSEAERNNTANSKPQISESKAEITWITGSTTSTAVTEFTLPYAPDDAISWNETTGEFSSTESDAPQKALNYGRIQNALLLGNRNGVSLQLAPEQMPPTPFDPLYLQAGGITGAYRINGTSWAFDSNGIVASTDALLWGAVSAAPGTDLTSSWIPLAPGTTTLPGPYTPTTGTTNSETGVTYDSVITPAVVLAPYLESVATQGGSRSFVVVTEYPYALNRGTETQVAPSRTRIVVGSKVTADAGAFALSGQAASLSYTRKLSVAATSFTVTGYSAGNIRDYAIGTNAGSFTSVGKEALLKADRLPLSAAPAAFAISGQDSTASVSVRLPSNAGVFVLTGQDASSVQDIRMPASAGSYTATGQDAGLGLADSSFSSVVLLLHMDGSNGSTTFTDNSNSAHSITALGNAAISTAQSMFGGSSAVFDGTGDALSIPDSDDWHLSTSDFTIECWIYPTSIPAIFTIASQRGTASNQNAWTLQWASSVPGLQWQFSSDGLSSISRSFSSWTPSVNTWYHVAITKSSGAYRCFINGTQLGGTQTNTTAIYNSNKPLLIGAQNNSSTTTSLTWPIFGYIDEFRLTKGVARYTSAFTAPTAPFPNF